MDNIIQLYLRTLNPQSLAGAQNSRTAELTARIEELEQQLTNCLLSEDKQLFLHLCDLWSEQSGNDRISTFITGFQLGARFSLDAFGLDSKIKWFCTNRFVAKNIISYIYSL